MTLTRNQKNHLWALFAICIIACFIGGLAYAIVWTGETTSVSHFCSGTTGFTVTNTHGDGQSVSYLLNDPRCH
jgi:hypothetical protein